MEINTLPETQFVDLFASTKDVQLDKKNGFGQHDLNLDIHNSSVGDTTTAASPSLDSTTTASPSLGDTTTQSPDLLGDDDKKAGRKPKYDFTDTSGYFEDRFKSGKFVKVQTENEKGEKVNFVPKTPEDFDEVIDLQVDYRLGKKEKELEQKIYQSKTPAWQAVLKYSELVDDPSEIIPFLSGVRTIESVKEVDETTVEGAERIVRTRLEQKGDTPELIEEQIGALKGADKLLSAAKQYKPMILLEETRNLNNLAQQKQTQLQEWEKDVAEIEQNVVKAIEAPLFGKKLQKEEKAIIYDLIAYPSQESGGYKIYEVIDALFAKRDAASTEMLTQIALLIGKKDNFFSYINANASQAAAAGLQKKLRLANESSSSSEKDDIQQDDTPVIQRRRFTSNFGR